MKKLLFALVALVVLLLTNPSTQTHRLAVADKMYNDLFLSEDNANKLEASPEARLAVETKVANGVTRKNFGVLSLTEWHLIINGHTYDSKILGIGFLGQVYLWASY